MDEAAAKALQEQVKALSDKLEAQTAQLTEAQTQLKDSSTFIEDASILVSAIMKNPELKGQVSAAVQGTAPAAPAAPATPTDDKSGWKFDPQTGKPINEPAQPAPDARIDSLDEKARLEVIDKIESKFRITNDQRKDMRKSVGAYLASWNMPIDKIPVSQLEDKLNDAYLHVGITQASKDGKEMDVVSSFREDPAKFPAMGSGAATQDSTQLTPEQKKWSQKLNISEDKVAAGLKELTEKGTITYKPKDEVKPADQKTPSGTPTPPAPTQ